MVHIIKNDYDKNYPYTLEGGWGGKIYCDEESLRRLQKDLEKLFEKPLDKSVKM
jgi:hypothetical protein